MDRVLFLHLMTTSVCIPLALESSANNQVWKFYDIISETNISNEKPSQTYTKSRGLTSNTICMKLH